MSTFTVFYDCTLIIRKANMPVDLILLPMNGFDIIQGMDWLAKYGVVLDCFLKRVRFNLERYNDVCVIERRRSVPTAVISIVKACKLLRSGCDWYTAFVTEEK